MILPSRPSRLRFYINPSPTSFPFPPLLYARAGKSTSRRPSLCVCRHLYSVKSFCVVFRHRCASSLGGEARGRGCHSEDFAAPPSHGPFVNQASHSQKTYHALYLPHRFFCRSLPLSFTLRSLILDLTILNAHLGRHV